MSNHLGRRPVAIPVGALLSGTLVEFEPAPRILIYSVVAAVLVVLAVGLFLSPVAGIAQGAANAGGMRAGLAGVSAGDRAGLLATIYLISYSGAAVPGLVAGRMAASVAPDHIALGYGVLILIASIVAVSTLNRRQLS